MFNIQGLIVQGLPHVRGGHVADWSLSSNNPDWVIKLDTNGMMSWFDGHLINTDFKAIHSLGTIRGDDFGNIFLLPNKDKQALINAFNKDVVLKLHDYCVIDD